ncbi:MAG TPA: xanthine dehydrogenase family protein subunit M [Candidatus Krumholzibacteriaceae bacterium]|nr:xanthine dehydrogenase family protein subunit M [Candidatus Krumholzibacteriaceae bacterium]
MNPINKHNTHIVMPFEYHQPTTVREAVETLKKHPGAKPLAGGTDLIPKMKQRLIEPKHVVNLKKIPEMSVVEDRGDAVYIGAAVRLREIEKSETVRRRLPLLSSCVKSIGSVQIRNMGTLGGNVCNASPAADGALGLVALEATVHIAGPEGERRVEAKDFFKGPGLTVLGEDEIVTGFTVPVPTEDTGTCFISVGRTALDISTISIAVALTMDGDRVKDAKIALGSVAPTPIRLADAEKQLKGKTLTEKLVEDTAMRVSESIKPITDIRGTAEYRREASRGMAVEAITKAWREGRTQR